MAFKRLSSEEMIQISSEWIDPKSEGHKAIAACKETAPLLPRMSAVHTTLAAAAQPGAEEPRLKEISGEQVKIDLRHDDIIRGSHLLLTGIAYLLGQEGGGAAMLALRDMLIPDGLESTQKSYRAEAGQASQLSSRLTPETATTLDTILVGPKQGKVSLRAFIKEWIEAGGSLGVLEDEKARLLAAPPEMTGAELLRARNQWVRVANALVANAELGELDAATEALVFGPLRAAERAADKRARGKAPA
ncbi:MAG: hypothetical protein ABI193_20625, partial [Minicystis sp.]